MDSPRTERVTDALRAVTLDAVVCALPTNVLLLTGYWPVVGTAVSIATRDGRVVLVTPEDELELARQSRADEVISYAPAEGAPVGVLDAVREPLRHAAQSLALDRSRIGYERGPFSEPASYAGMFLYGAGMADLLADACPSATLAPADAMLATLRSTPTPFEVERIRAACEIAARAFESGARQLAVGMHESDAAQLFQPRLFRPAAAVNRAGGYAFCMSGPNSARACAAYQRTRARRLQPGDLALVHCNSYVDGYWTDVTRTFSLGPPSDRWLTTYEAVFAARAAALASVRPGVAAADVDRAAREVIEARGFGPAFRHATGHGVGFAAINHDAPPRLCPGSRDVLAEGMVCNVEPGLYAPERGGIRHCDMVLVTRGGAQVLTPFLSRLEDLVLHPRRGT